MAIKVKIVMLITAFICSCVPASLHLDDLQANMEQKTACGNGIAQPNKFAHASAGGPGSRPVAVGRSHPQDGGSQSSYMQGGSATIPLYTAGAAAAAAGGSANDHRNNNRNHSGSNRNYDSVEVVTLALYSLLACLILRKDV